MPNKVPVKRRQELLDLPPVASMPLHHGVGGRPHILGCAPLACYQVHNEGELACEPVQFFVGSSSERAG